MDIFCFCSFFEELFWKTTLRDVLYRTMESDDEKFVILEWISRIISTPYTIYQITQKYDEKAETKSEKNSGSIPCLLPDRHLSSLPQHLNHNIMFSIKYI